MRKWQELEFFTILSRGKRASLHLSQHYSKSHNVYENSFIFIKNDFPHIQYGKNVRGL
ncbi:hypothetical protein V7201_03860 [Bacillus sp. JJ1122]